MPDTYTSLLFHVVFSTKNRAPLIDEDIRDRLYAYLGGVTRQEGAQLLEIGGMPDHVHLLIQLKPTVALADLVRKLKANSSRWLNDGIARERFQWQAGYGAFSVSRSAMPQLTRYIRHQAEHHRTRSFRDEMAAILDRHGLSLDDLPGAG